MDSIIVVMLINHLLKLLPSKPIYAHCDIPCGIYDPHASQMAAKTVARMVKGLKEVSKEDMNNFVRMVNVKEEHAEICKKEILILWTDYFKTEHLDKFPDLHDLVWKTAKLCSENKRHVDEQKAQELIEAVDKIAEIFTQTKKQ